MVAGRQHRRRAGVQPFTATTMSEQTSHSRHKPGTRPPRARRRLHTGHVATTPPPAATADLPQLSQQADRLARSVGSVESQVDQLLGTIAHDLGANLLIAETSCRDLQRALADDPRAAAEAATHLAACLRQSRRFLADVGTLARTGSVSMEAARVDLDAAVRDVLFEQKDLLAERGVRVDVRGPLGTAWAHPLRARQVLTNLVRNALRHAFDGWLGSSAASPQRDEPRIEIAPTMPPEFDRGLPPRGGRLWLRLSDNGRGIPPAWRQRVFQPGQRAPGAAEDGSGLGLAIVRRIIEYYGGTIHVDPQHAPGASFVFSLPAAE
jgi:signal transduction histidine kinase